MTTELSKPVIQGLQYLGNIIPFEVSKQLIANCVKLTIHPNATITPVPEIYANHADKAKHSEYAVVALLSMATKNTWSDLQLRKSLEELEIDSLVAEELIRIYEEQRKDLILRQLQVGFNFPHITDVQWRIVSDVKSSTSNRSSGEVGFIINLGRFHSITGQRETIVEFNCNTEELQLLINKLKEIERHCEKIGND